MSAPTQPGLPVIVPAWPAPANVVAMFTTRQGGTSIGPWADGQGRGGLNLGDNCGDDPHRVDANRRRLEAAAGLPIRWLRQVHSDQVLEITGPAGTALAAGPPVADGQVTTVAGIALGVLVADCLPVLLTDRIGSIVGVAHAGWRGLAAGVLENTVHLMRRRRPDADIVAWLGPCIGPAAFEVGADVRQAFVSQDPQSADDFVPAAAQGKWLADLRRLAAGRLRRAGVSSLAGDEACTVTDAQNFWSYRRDRVCGRMAGLVGLRGRDR